MEPVTQKKYNQEHFEKGVLMKIGADLFKVEGDMGTGCHWAIENVKTGERHIKFNYTANASILV